MLTEVALWLQLQMKQHSVSAVPYGAQPYLGDKSEYRANFEGQAIELPHWDDDPEEKKADEHGNVNMPL